jgi:multidrug efflux pump subunit AcrA (membrane-fusion protein)
LIALFPQQRWWFMVFLSVYIGFCTYLMTGKKNQYFYQVMAFVCVIICFDGGVNSLNAFQTAMARIQQTGMGILVYTLVSVFLWPRTTAGELNEISRKLVAVQRGLFETYRKLMTGKDPDVDSRSQRMQEVQLLTRLEQILDAAEVRSAELNLEFTQKKAPVDGYVTNLNLRLGSQAVENQPIMALVDVNSYWVTGFFRENYIEDIREGDRAIITLMSYPDKPLEGRVDWGIAQNDGSTGFDLLPTISPTFEWIRLAQRAPVRIHLDKLPKDVKLRVGTTASVLVMTGTGGSKSEKPAVAAPKALQ